MINNTIKKERMKAHKIALLVSGFIAILLGACGEKTDPSDIWGEDPTLEIRPLSYVPILPIWDIQGDPTDVFAGFDEHIYVVDEATERVIAYNLSLDPNQAVERFVPGARAVAQDLQLNLLVLGNYDTTLIIGSDTLNYTLPAIYKFATSSFSSFSLNTLIPVDTIIHPFYYALAPTNRIIEDGQQVTFNDIDVLSDNSFYVTRSGPIDNPRSSIGMGPDDAVLLFNSEGEFQREVVIFDQALGRNQTDFFKTPFGISTRVFPVSGSILVDINPSRDFIVTFRDPEVARNVVYVGFQESETETFYYVQDIRTPSSESGGPRYLYSLGIFEDPVGVEISQRNIFVTDAGKDTVFQFNTLSSSNPTSAINGGQEGIQPQLADGSLGNFVPISFGGTGSTPDQFNRPWSVAFIDDLVVVVDRGNRRVLKFKLTTDFEE